MPYVKYMRRCPWFFWAYFWYCKK